MEMLCAKSSVLSRAGPSQGGLRVGLCCERCQDARGRQGGAVRKRRRRLGDKGVAVVGWRGTLLTGDLGLVTGLIVGAEQLGLDGLNHTLETSAGT